MHTDDGKLTIAGKIILLIVTLVLMAADLYAFYNMLIWGGENTVLEASLFSAFLSASLFLIPFFLATALKIHIGTIWRQDAQKIISRVALIGAIILALGAQTYVTSVRFNTITGHGRTSYMGFEAAETTNENISFDELGSWDAFWIGFRQHWRFDEFMNEIFANYPGFTVDLLLLISPFITSIAAFLLSWFFSEGQWWRNTLRNIVKAITNDLTWDLEDKQKAYDKANTNYSQALNKRNVAMSELWNT